MKDYKGKNAEVTVYRVDAGIIQLMRVLLDIGKRAAMELGRWQHKDSVVSAVTSPASSPPAKRRLWAAFITSLTEPPST